MSDDTPTQKFPAGGDNPTERIATGEIQEDLKEEKQKSKGLLIGLISAGALLLAAILVLVFMLGRSAGDGTPQAGDTQGPVPVDTPTPGTTPSEVPIPSDSPTPEPTEEPQQPPQPPSNALAIDSFKVSNKTVLCNTQSPVPSNQYISFSWKTTGADTITIGTYDPYGDYSGYYYNLPPDGNTADLGLQITYGCPQPSQKWRLEITGDGQTIKQEIKITNNGDTQ